MKATLNAISKAAHQNNDSHFEMCIVELTGIVARPNIIIILIRMLELIWKTILKHEKYRNITRFVQAKKKFVSSIC